MTSSQTTGVRNSIKTAWYMSFAFWSILSLVSPASAAELPPDVTAFVERRDGCDHFRGEEPYDEERAAFVTKNLIELCTGTDKELARLKGKYTNDPKVLSKLDAYEPQIEPDPL